MVDAEYVAFFRHGMEACKVFNLMTADAELLKEKVKLESFRLRSINGPGINDAVHEPNPAIHLPPEIQQGVLRHLDIATLARSRASGPQPWRWWTRCRNFRRYSIISISLTTY